MKKILTGLAAAALLAGQSAAVIAAPAPIERASATTADGFEAAEGETFLYVALVLATVLGTVIVLAGDEDKTTPLAPYSP